MKHVVRLGQDKAAERYFATVTGRPEIFEIDKPTFNSFARPLSDLENRRFFMIRFEDVGRIVVNRLGQRFEVARDGAQFKLISPENKTVTMENWRGLVWKIINLRYDNLRQGPQGPVGLEKPSLAISVYNTSGVLVDEVSVGAKDPARDIYYANSSKKRAVCAIDAVFVNDEIVKSLEGLLGSDDR